MTTRNEKSRPEVAPSATATELGNGSTAIAYLAYHPDNTRHTFGTWGGEDLPMKDHITIIVPMKTAQRMYADGPQLIGLNRECADAQSARVRKARRKATIDARVRERIGELEDTIRAEVEAELDAENREGDR